MNSRFEELPNEVIYEIFDYLSLCQAWESFSPLNKRFDDLFADLPLNLKLDFSSLSKRHFPACCSRLFEPNIARLLSLRLSNPLTIDLFLSIYSFDEHFIRLESLFFNQLDSQQLPRIVKELSFLPRLSSLTIQNHLELLDASTFYRVIFRLPKLSWCLLSPQGVSRRLSMFPAVDQFSSLEYLRVNRHFTLNELLLFLSYLPRLHHLSILSLSESVYSTSVVPRLTHFAVKFCRLSFGLLKEFSSKFFRHLESFRLSTRADDHYLMAERWEELLRREMPSLRCFDFQHFWEPMDNDLVEQQTYHSLIERFNSKFWTDRQWFFAHQHFLRRAIRDSVFYSTNPYRSARKRSSREKRSVAFLFFSRRNLYELHERAHSDCCPRTDRGGNFARRVNIDDYRAATNSPLRFPLARELCLWGKGARGNFSFLSDLSQMFPFPKLTHLSIQCPDFGLVQLLDLLNHLPQLEVLTLYSNTSYLSERQTPPVDGSLKNSRIRQVIIRGRSTVGQVELLLNLCPQLQSFELNIDEERLESIVRCLLIGSKTPEVDSWHRKFLSRFQTKKPTEIETSLNPSLSSLCFFNGTPAMEQRLQRFLHREKLLEDYSLGIFASSLYLWW